MYSFGSGVLLGTRTDIPNATPINFGLVQEVTIEESASVKELTGQFQYPLAIGRGAIKTTGKAKVARSRASPSPISFMASRHPPGRLRRRSVSITLSLRRRRSRHRMRRISPVTMVLFMRRRGCRLRRLPRIHWSGNMRSRGAPIRSMLKTQTTLSY